MILKVMKFFRGYLLVRLTGYSPERFFNLCGNADIILWNMEQTEEGYTFYISLPAFRKLKPMLTKKRNQGPDPEACRGSVSAAPLPSSPVLLRGTWQSLCDPAFDGTVYLGG